MDQRQLIGEIISARHGHFVFESGHHGDVWLELERLCLQPEKVRPLVAELAEWVNEGRAEVICGPLVEGAFVALMAAEQLGAQFTYAERIERPGKTELFPTEYRLPTALRKMVRGRRVAIVNDVVNAGSAVRGTAADLVACGAELVGIACLMTMGEAAEKVAQRHGVPLFQLAAEDANLWTPHECPLCRDGVPVD